MNLPRLTKLGLAALVSVIVGCTDQQPIVAPPAEGPTGKATQALTPTGFDFENGDISAEYIIPFASPLLRQNGALRGGDATIILYATSTAMACWFDAIAPYSTTMVGLFSRIPRRPASEGINNYNRNIAEMYAGYHAFRSVFPQYESSWRLMLTQKGLDPDDNSMDLSTPVGIGNSAAKAVIDARARDGFNRDGDEGGRKYNRRRYEDYTGYEPVNSPFDLKDPSRWQPKIVTRGSGIFEIQKYVTPQYARTSPFSFSRDEIKDYRVSEPIKSNFRRNRAAYKAQADEVLEASANLNDQTKMVAEFFDDKNGSLGRGGDFIRRRDGQTAEQWIQYDYLLQIASFDAGIPVWSEKTRYDSVRPWTAIKQIYGKKKVRAWGGVGKGTVNDLPGDEWESYLPVADHPEYPSGSACFCAAHAQASRRWLGNDTFGWTITRPKGSSVIEPGITPAADVTISFPTFSDWERQCGDSRVNAGVHFKSAVEASIPMCREIGDRAYEFLMPYITGQVD